MSRIRAAAEETGVEIKTPDYLESLSSEGERIWLAFSQLSARRPSEQGYPKPISMEAIWCYIDLVLSNSTEDEVEDLLFFLQKLDDKYLELQTKRLEKSRKKPGKRGSRG